MKGIESNPVKPSFSQDIPFSSKGERDTAIDVLVAIKELTPTAGSLTIDEALTLVRGFEPLSSASGDNASDPTTERAEPEPVIERKLKGVKPQAPVVLPDSRRVSNPPLRVMGSGPVARNIRPNQTSTISHPDIID